MPVYSLLPSVALAVLAASAPYAAAQDDSNTPTPEPPEVAPFNWTSVEPTTDLQWQECYTPPLQCTRFSVPLNYSDPDQGSAAIAVIRVPSPLADTDDYRGPVFFNPGGPGGSGIDEWIAGTGVYLSTIVGKEFDFVTFDPRGVKESTPGIQLYENDEDLGNFIGEMTELLSLEPNTTDTLPERLETLRGYGAEYDENFGDINRHMATDNVARDMLALAEAHGQDKIQYWGISYGSILGATFAAMFPDKIERFVIDGVADVQGYFSSNWAEAIADADKALDAFFRQCADAGPELCAFHNSTAEEIHSRYDALYEPVVARQVELSDGSTLPPSAFEAAVHKMLYWPHMMSDLAKTLAAFELGDTLAFGEGAQGGAEEDGPQTPLGTIIRCLDSEPVEDSEEELTAWAEDLREATKYFPGAVEGARLFCAGWQTNSPDTFRGPFEGNLSHPMLLIGNQFDVATPLAAARAVSEGFPGSVVLTLNVTGHTTLARESSCIWGHLREYFINGNLPEADTVCQPDEPNLFAAPTPPGQGGGEGGEGDGGEGDEGEGGGEDDEGEGGEGEGGEGDEGAALGGAKASWGVLGLALSFALTFA